MEKLWQQLNEIMSVISGTLLGLTMVIVGIDVVARYIFNNPIIGVTDLVTLFIPIFVFLPLAATEIHNKHIRVEFMTENWSPVWRNILEIVAFFAGLILMGFMAWVLWGFALDAFSAGQYLPGLRRIRAWPTKFCMAFGATLFFIQCMLGLLKNVIHLKQPSAKKK